MYRIKQEDSYNMRIISRRLHSFLPNFVTVDVIDDVENKQYIIVLYDVDGKVYTSRVLSEGTLRILSLCILYMDNKHKGLLCFEEPENGIHPFRVEMMAVLLKDLSTDFLDAGMPLRQVIVNTHSTVFVSVIYQWLSSPFVSIDFARMVTRICSINGEKKKLIATKIIPVPKDNPLQSRIPFSEQDSKSTLQMMNEFMLSNDNESIKG